MLSLFHQLLIVGDLLRHPDSPGDYGYVFNHVPKGQCRRPLDIEGVDMLACSLAIGAQRISGWPFDAIIPIIYTNTQNARSYVRMGSTSAVADSA